MTRKDYEAIAHVFSTRRASIHHSTVGFTEAEIEAMDISLQVTVEAFADMLYLDNNRFESHRFMKACGF